jgi:RNA polymerase sigma-70 factor (ECF subfamily)
MELPANRKPNDPRFAQTQWSLVRKAAGTDSSARLALEKLCQAYWYPLYAFVRRTGSSPHDAEDATQGFFLHLIDKGALAKVDQELGTFRSFLLAALKNFMSHEREKANAQKRGGGQTPVALDAHSAEERYALEPKDSLSPDRLYDRRWALTLLERTQLRLRHEYLAGGKGELFDTLARLGMTEGALKTAVHRLRDRYRATLRSEVAETVADPADIEEELRFLIESL